MIGRVGRATFTRQPRERQRHNQNHEGQGRAVQRGSQDPAAFQHPLADEISFLLHADIASLPAIHVACV